MDEKITLWTKLEHKLAIRLILLGATQRRWLWIALSYLLPSLAGLTASLAEVYRADNMILWSYDRDDDGPGSLAETISEMINRAPTPLGFDRFVILVEQLAAIAGDPEEMTLELADATLGARRVVREWTLRGERWRDWKKGSSRQELDAILQQAVPTPEAPVTLIRAAVLGRTFARMFARFGTIY